ncbi:SAM and SH3 domain-containing protein 3, partial [Gryllus bimaculatus]
AAKGALCARRVCFTLNLRPEARGEGVISLRSAGDISLPRDGVGGVGVGGARGARRGLLLPPAGAFPGAIIPLGRGDRESGDYASSDVQSVGSRLSTMSIETSRSEQPEAAPLSSPSYLPAAAGGGFRRLQRRRDSGGASPGHSSGDDGDPRTVHPHVTVHAVSRRAGHAHPALTKVWFT